MPTPNPQSCNHFIPVFGICAAGILISVAIAQGALAGSEPSSSTQASSTQTFPADVASSQAAPAASTPKVVALTGPQVYTEVCIACHAPPGLGGAPALGDGDAWAPRIAQGMDTLIDHALHGFTGSTGIMPRKGERLDLSDEEIIAAVEYMVEQAEE